ncbi:hypothetical protein [Dysgonomonas sp. 25]|uniref:hypothetical protein n=1 Tax=Dysgonomonas sp. 25 TaxID=2302933 RepID=UPI0013D49F06|nr:hypothetical protein [Dysgonomonas sp. 25]NDV68514.1 hypothetical protein [Dysgonomonas sp. 25]
MNTISPNRIKDAITILETGNPFQIENLIFRLEKKKFLNFTGKDVLVVLAYTKYLELENLNKPQIISELEYIEKTFVQLKNTFDNFNTFCQHKSIEYILSYNYGMGAIGIATKKGNKIHYIYDKLT